MTNRIFRLAPTFSFSFFVALAGCAVDPAGDDSLAGTGGIPGTGGVAGTGATTGTGAAPAGGAGSGAAPGTGGGVIGTGGGGPEVPNLPEGRGAALPFATYEAEVMTTNGSVLGPTRTFGQVAAEASGRRAVRLDTQGEYVEFTNAAPSNSIVVRYSIPDLGADHWTTLTVLVDGAFRTKLNVTSRYSWTYGDESHFNQPDQNDAGLGHPHHFFDEARALVGDIPVGSTVTIRKDSGDNATHYDVDFVEMEQVAPPLEKPAGYLSITDCGATPNDSSDDSGAIQSCIDQAEGGGVYVPPGTFRVTSDPISARNVTVRGAGMWHSTLSGYYARFDCYGNDCEYYDFASSGDTTVRLDDSPETAFSGNGSSNVVLERIWVEHHKVGYWTGPATSGLRISQSRFRNLHADGVNLYGGTHDSVVENSHFRNTGDDALAMWAHNTNGYAASHDNTFRHNTIQLPWKANCIGLYGGTNHHVEDNVCLDTIQYPGFLFARQFGCHAFAGMIHVDRNSLVRAGGTSHGQDQGALKFHAAEGPVQNVTVTELDIFEPTFGGIHVQGENFVDSVWLNGVTIRNAAKGSFFLNWGSWGALDAVNVVASGGVTYIIDDSKSDSNPNDFTVIAGPGSSW